MKKIIAVIQLILAYLYLWPHALFYLLSSNDAKTLIYSDVRKINDKMNVKFSGVNAVIYVILRDVYYRRLFYHRIGTLSVLVSWYFPGERTFEPICSSIGGGVYLAHPSSTYLNAKFIGENFTCRQNTTIGNKFDGGNDALPKIGDNVILGANVCIIGDIVIGDNVIIGAGSVVIKDIPSDSIAVGNPARIINKQL